MKISFFEIQNWEKTILQKSLKGHSLKFFEEPISQYNIKQIKQTEVLSVFVNSTVDKLTISSLSKLKLIITRSTGFDHIDTDEAKKRKIQVCNMPAYGENTVAEHAFALILALSRKIHESHLRRLTGDFSLEGLKGFDLEGKTIGVIGAGNIGKHVIRIARGFNMKVIALAHHPDEFLAEQLNLSYVPLPTLLKKSDIITIHIPYCKENHHFINKKSLDQMK